VTAATDSRDGAPAGQSLRLLSYNIQVGIETSRFRHYFTGGWKHLLPHDQRQRTLALVADRIRGYDVVAIQEADAGSRRTRYISQTEYLARRAGYSWWGERTNRRLGRFAQHSIGALARWQPDRTRRLALPGLVPGRGALQLEFGTGTHRLVVVIVHLALGRMTRRRQLDYVAERIAGARHVVVMGDFNAPGDAPEMQRFFTRTHLDEPTDRLNTWPAWRPRRNFDHILTSPELSVERMEVLDGGPSDHLPLAVDLTLPRDCALNDDGVPGALNDPCPSPPADGRGYSSA